MALLTDTDIKEIRAQKGSSELRIQPFDSKFLTPVGYDLRVGNEYSLSSNPQKHELRSGKRLKIEAGETALITTLEELTMPENRTISGFVMSKVSLVSKGLSQISTTIDADWTGKLLVAVHNMSTTALELNHGDPFCTVVFIENRSASTVRSKKVDSRHDILSTIFSDRLKPRLSRKVKGALSLSLFVLSSALAYLYFGSSEAFSGTVAVLAFVWSWAPQLLK